MATPTTVSSNESRFLTVRSFVRVRPFVGKEAKILPENSKFPRPVLDVDPTEPNKILVLDPATKFKPRKHGAFALDTDVLWSFTDPVESPGGKALPPPASQTDLYDAVIKPLLPSIGDGFSTAFLFLGGADSGKSHTLFGESQTQEPAIFSCFTDDLFSTLEDVRRDNSTQLVEVEVTEINGEMFTDLLAKKTAHGSRACEEMKVMQDAGEGTYLSHSTRISVCNPQELDSVVKQAVRSQKKKKNSVVVTIRVEETYHFIDPNADQTDAGVAKSRRFNVVFALLRNLSPSFKRCVELAYERDALDKTNTKIPVRESSATKLLADVFNGLCNVSVVTHVSPYFEAIKDSIVSLDLATRFSKIRTNPRHNHDSSMLEMRRLSDEVKNLSTAVLQENKNMQVVQDELNRRQVALEKAEEENAAATQLLAQSEARLTKGLQSEDVAKARLSQASEQKQNAIERVQQIISDTTLATTAANAQKHKIVAKQQSVLENTASLEGQVGQQRRDNEPIADQLSEIRAFQQDIEDMEALVNGAPEDRKKLVEARQNEVTSVREEIVQLNSEVSVEGEKRDQVAARVNELKPAYDKKASSDAKRREAQLRVQQQEDEIAALEKEIANLAQENSKLEAQIKAIPAGCCAIS